jgi:hypothetical protein
MEREGSSSRTASPVHNPVHNLWPIRANRGRSNDQTIHKTPVQANDVSLCSQQMAHLKSLGVKGPGGSNPPPSAPRGLHVWPPDIFTFGCNSGPRSVCGRGPARRCAPGPMKPDQRCVRTSIEGRLGVRGRLRRSVGCRLTDELGQSRATATPGLWWEPCRFASLVLGLTELERV